MMEETSKPVVDQAGIVIPNVGRGGERGGGGSRPPYADPAIKQL